ncbi:MAG: pantoate--beta-alanine ligase [Steroidobacteraceae bacterium]
MIVIDHIPELREQVRSWRAAGQRIGFVPTMGSLHAGHLSLLSAARARADRVVASIFVNPLQFGPGEDFERYPRTPENDRQLLADAGCDLLFSPPVAEIYPDGGQSATTVSVPHLAGILCGAHRPGHFDGVATVVAKLFGIVQPDVAVFGEKDYQQLAVIRRMVADLALPVQIVGAPTVRSPDGLAMSSRNLYLSAAERALAPRLYVTLRALAARIDAGERDFALIGQLGLQQLREAGFDPDYCEVRDAATLDPPRADSAAVVILAAARLGKARLIDNLQVSL